MRWKEEPTLKGLKIKQPWGSPEGLPLHCRESCPYFTSYKGQCQRGVEESPGHGPREVQLPYVEARGAVADILDEVLPENKFMLARGIACFPSLRLSLGEKHNSFCCTASPRASACPLPSPLRGNSRSCAPGQGRATSQGTGEVEVRCSCTAIGPNGNEGSKSFASPAGLLALLRDKAGHQDHAHDGEEHEGAGHERSEVERLGLLGIRHEAHAGGQERDGQKRDLNKGGHCPTDLWRKLGTRFHPGVPPRPSPTKSMAWGPGVNLPTCSE